MPKETFELEIFGAKPFKNHRNLRPDVEQLPWGTIDLNNYDPKLIEAARYAWTRATFQEFSTAYACAITQAALIEARAPIDLISLLARFSIDELVHVELCSRAAEELGGGVEWNYDPKKLFIDYWKDCEPIIHAAHLVVAVFCIGESYSIPLISKTSLETKEPLLKAILQTIVKDEADHGEFGWQFLTWAEPYLSDNDKLELSKTAISYIEMFYKSWEPILKKEKDPNPNEGLGWLPADKYMAVAKKAIDDHVIKRLLEFGIVVPARLQKK
jgi:hypothetical protein